MHRVVRSTSAYAFLWTGRVNQNYKIFFWDCLSVKSSGRIQFQQTEATQAWAARLTPLSSSLGKALASQHVQYIPCTASTYGATDMTDIYMHRFSEHCFFTQCGFYLVIKNKNESVNYGYHVLDCTSKLRLVQLEQLVRWHTWRYFHGASPPIPA